MTPSARRLRSPVAALFGVAGQGPGLGVHHLGYVTGPAMSVSADKA